MSSRKAMQLGMNPSTASGRLVKDLLWAFILKCDANSCHRCGKEMSRETFSIEHIEPWLNSEDPVKLFFDVENISFSHLSCNREAVRGREILTTCGSVAEYTRGCRCDPCKTAKATYAKARYSPEERLDTYRRLGH